MSRSQDENPLYIQEGKPLLNSPFEVIHMIADYLGPVDLALFSETCRALRAILQRRTNISLLSREEYLTYLVTRARGLPTHWVCAECMTLHCCADFNTVSSFPDNNLPCLSMYRLRLMGRNRQILLLHHHIQLAVKLTRLQHHEHESYLQVLLAPHFDNQFGPQPGVPLLAYYAALPKVVNNLGDLRFLLSSTWRYFKGTRPISLRNIGYQKICPHLELNYTANDYLRRGFWRVLEDVVVLAIKEAQDGGESQEWTGSCPRCATDFAVNATTQYLDLRAWHDFGRGVSPLDLEWQSHCCMGFDGDANSRYAGLTLYHEPGSVRELYEEADADVRELAEDPSSGPEPSVPENQLVRYNPYNYQSFLASDYADYASEFELDCTHQQEGSNESWHVYVR
ncbi:hypothetical protein GGR53DRAFT_466682 [Hypoxylon sp. FL1150]|nr:hypothetical protein GGR53DRAFT_466682 [Hypoxylon sp. FL1150]